MKQNIETPMRPNLAVIILAAGKGMRMNDSSKAKVMYDLNGKPMLYYVLRLAEELHSSRVLAIVGYQRDVVIEYLNNTHPNVEYVIQEPQLGTGHAVMQAEKPLKNYSGDVLVLSGDVPLLRAETIRNLISLHREKKAVASMLTTETDDPSGYGRIVRNENGVVKKIVEHRDANSEELALKEINSGIYVFEKEALFEGLKHIKANNSQKEYYLTDVFEYFWNHEWNVAASIVKDSNEIRGINTFEQLQEAINLFKKGKRS